MPVIISGDGIPKIGPPGDDDPTRQAQARLTAALGWELEMNLQAHDAFDAQIADLRSRVGTLEQLLIAPERAS
jgi:hypothetical protein